MGLTRDNEIRMESIVKFGQGRIVRELKKSVLENTIIRSKEYNLNVYAAEILADANTNYRNFSFHKVFKNRNDLINCLSAPPGNKNSFSYQEDAKFTRYCVYLKVVVNGKVICEREFRDDFFWAIVYFKFKPKEKSNAKQDPSLIKACKKMNEFVKTFNYDCCEVLEV